MKHVTEDEHVRDWYFNTRLGVFNNAIADNITVTSEEVDGEIIETVEDSTDYADLEEKHLAAEEKDDTADIIGGDSSGFDTEGIDFDSDSDF